MFVTLTALGFGLVRGMGHALEPDHMAAVSTLMAGTKASPRMAFALGAVWGVGHTLTLLLVAGGLHLSRTTLPPAAERSFTLVVAAMLVTIGLRSLGTALRHAFGGKGRPPTPSSQAPAHGAPAGTSGQNGHGHDGTRPSWAFVRRPLVVGLVHGLAGSGAMTAMVAAELPSPMEGLCYMALFGLGSMAGMAALSGVVGAPVARAAQSPRLMPLLVGLSGAFSLGLGLASAWDEVHTLAFSAAAEAAIP